MRVDFIFWSGEREGRARRWNGKDGGGKEGANQNNDGGLHVGNCLLKEVLWVVNVGLGLVARSG